jgi:hypothetical protein
MNMGVCIMCGESTSNPFGLCSDECYEDHQKAQAELAKTVVEGEDEERWTTTDDNWGLDDVVVIEDEYPF